MINVCLERCFDTPLTPELVLALSQDAKGCFRLHRVVWCSSLLANDGRRMLCHFQAPDAESARIALNQVGADISNLWLATVHDAPGISRQWLRRKRNPTVPTYMPPPPNVLVERAFEEPANLTLIQAREDAEVACLEYHRVRFVRTFFAGDHLRMICLYQAPDAESVRLAQHQAGMPFERVWAFRAVRPTGHTDNHAAL